jgi:mRNA interferase YafQ
MTSKKPASSKRASIPRRCDYTKTFEKDWERMSRSGRYDMHLLKEVMGLLIANDAPLPPEWLDHELKGNWSDHRECHVGGDFL